MTVMSLSEEIRDSAVRHPDPDARHRLERWADDVEALEATASRQDAAPTGQSASPGQGSCREQEAVAAGPAGKPVRLTGAQVRRIRELLEWTQLELALEVGCSQNTVSKIEAKPDHLVSKRTQKKLDGCAAIWVRLSAIKRGRDAKRREQA